jgi:hypothetical protein
MTTHHGSKSRHQREQANSRSYKYEQIGTISPSSIHSQAQTFTPIFNEPQAHCHHLPAKETNAQPKIPSNLTIKIKCLPHSAAQTTTNTAQNSTRRTSAMSFSTWNSYTSLRPSASMDTSGAATLAKGNQAGSAESTAPIRRCGIISLLVTRIGLRILSRRRTGLSFRWWSCGHAVGMVDLLGTGWKATRKVARA